ncbi:MAG: glutamine-hydrolyzing carbamoyl-phosphate synthase small subunit [Bacteroidia bacterium]|nr:glutamine-hydrolyzing carbamoyl-phosphate synthase small subunit [Bacteroidia bacterium]
MKKAVLLLADGSQFEGSAAGANATLSGELCFTTGMTGYQEIFTDPSYAGQILITTHTHIGNYGIHAQEYESKKIQISGLVCRNFSKVFSRKQQATTIQTWFQASGVPVLEGIDTRELVKRIRDKGAMNAILTTESRSIEELRTQLLQCPDMSGLELSSVVSTPVVYQYGSSNAKYKIAVLDYGIKENILRQLASRDCFLTVFPAKTTAHQIINQGFDGFFLSNGPGDPSAMTYAIETIQTLIQQEKPIFGICLGNQLLALAYGAKTYKMKHGHRGLNHPVLNLQTNRAEITSQNHGFAIEPNSVDKIKQLRITHINLNDQTIEGIEVLDKPFFSVQYHPEAAPGPHDSHYLFDKFLDKLTQTKN